MSCIPSDNWFEERDQFCQSYGRTVNDIMEDAHEDEYILVSTEVGLEKVYLPYKLQRNYTQHESNKEE